MHLNADALLFQALASALQALLDDGERLFKLHARPQRARRDEAGQRAARLLWQPCVAPGGAGCTLQVILQLRSQLDPLVLSLLCSRQKFT